VTVGDVHEDADPAFGTARAGYHGNENRLYRVEIHEPGTLGDGATFKWSRDNGAVAFAIRSIADRIVTLEAVGRDERADIVPGDWVEIVDDDDAGTAKPARNLFAVSHADPALRTVTLRTPPGYVVRSAKHPVLRRWDQRSAPIVIPRDSDSDPRWIPLEDGIAIRFVALQGRIPAIRGGDYWTIPARTAGGGIVLWERTGSGIATRRSRVSKSILSENSSARQRIIGERSCHSVPIQKFRQRKPRSRTIRLARRLTTRCGL